MLVTVFASVVQAARIWAMAVARSMAEVWQALAARGKKLRDLLRQSRTDALHAGDLLGRGALEPRDGAEVRQELLFARLRDAGAVVEQALGDATFHEELMVAVGKPMRLVADALEQPQRA